MLGLFLVAIGLVAGIRPGWLASLTNRPVREVRLVGFGLALLGLVKMGSGAGYLLFGAGFVAAALGLVGLIRPLHRLRIPSRKVAAAVLGAALALMVTGAAIAGPGTPPEPAPSEQTTAEAPSPADPSPQPAKDPAASGAAGATPTVDASASAPATPPAPPPSGSAKDAGPSSSASSTKPAASSQPSKATEPGRAALPAGVTVAVVTRVVDGDTIDVKYLEGAKLPATRVRMIGVDTPEVYGKKEPYGPEASAFTKKQLAGKKVWLEKDVSETDRYGRALRYVWVKQPPADPSEKQVREGMFNAMLVLQGYAQVSTYPPDVKYANLFVKFQREARAGNRGLWGLSASSGSASGGTKSGSGSSKRAKTSNESGGASRSGKCDPAYPDVCIPPPPPDLDCKDIKYRNFRVLPPDPHRLDGRDGDGIGCES